MSDSGDYNCSDCGTENGQHDPMCTLLTDAMKRASIKSAQTKKQARFHVRDIKKGSYGELSKIREELEEAEDAEEQGLRVMLLLELGDIVGAVEGYLENHFKGFTLEELIRFQRLRSAVSIAQGWNSK